MPTNASHQYLNNSQEPVWWLTLSTRGGQPMKVNTYQYECSEARPGLHGGVRADHGGASQTRPANTVDLRFHPCGGWTSQLPGGDPGSVDRAGVQDDD